MNKIDTGEYSILKDGAGFARLAGHGVIELTGDDRNGFLNNFCTADLKKLPLRGVTEAFILNEKGKCMLFANVVALENRLLLVFHNAGNVPEIIAHLDKYLIREDVELFDRSKESSVWFAAGAKATETLVAASIVEEEFDATENSSLDTVVAARAEVAGGGWLIVASSATESRVETNLADAGLQLISTDAIDAVRVENVTPWNGIESSLENLPQELDRIEKSISFTKGCYLGQETVARLDALGRVNWLLRGLRCNSLEQPECPCLVEQDGKKIARITAIAWSPIESCWYAIGFVKRGFEKQGSSVGVWTVRDND